MLGQYKVVRLIGSGGMGEVYEALEVAIERRVALKVINEKGMDSDEMVQRFLGEAKALARLSHTNVVNLLAFGQIDKQYYMAMEFIEGTSLDDFIKRSPYGIDETLRIFRQLLDGMQAAHAAAIIHRDLKPANIIIDKNKNVKIIDFGIAKLIGDQDGYKTATGMFIGTLNYLAPEIARGYPPGHQTDIYGMGVILYEMLTGRVPFVGKNTFETLEQIRNKPIEFPKKIEVLLPDSVKRLILKMTAKKLPDRYASVADVITDLNAIDLNEIPSELKVQSVHARKVVNFDDIQKRMRSKGYEDPEIKMIVNLACDIQTEMSFDPNKTVATGEQSNEITLSDGPLQEALERFTFVRSDLSQKKTMANATFAAAHTRQHERHEENSMNFALIMGVVVLIGGGLFWKTMLRPAPKTEITQSSTAKPVAEPTVAAEAGENQRGVAFDQAQQVIPKDDGLNERGLDKDGKPLAATLPRYKLGEQFVFSVRSMKPGEENRIKENLVRWTVSQDLGEDYAWMSEQGAYRVTKRNMFVGPTQQLNTTDGGLDYTELKIGDTHAPYPLAVGRSSSYILDGKTVDELKKWRVTRTCKVTGYQQQKTSLGHYWTYKVECRQDDNANNIEIFYYSPTLRTSVLKISRQYDSGGKTIDTTTEIKDYRAPASK